MAIIGNVKVKDMHAITIFSTKFFGSVSFWVQASSKHGTA